MWLDCIIQVHAWRHEHEHRIYGFKETEQNSAFESLPNTYKNFKKWQYKIHVFISIYTGFPFSALHILHVFILSLLTGHTHSTSLVYFFFVFCGLQGGQVLYSVLCGVFAWGASGRVSELCSLSMSKNWVTVASPRSGIEVIKFSPCKKDDLGEKPKTSCFYDSSWAFVAIFIYKNMSICLSTPQRCLFFIFIITDALMLLSKTLADTLELI